MNVIIYWWTVAHQIILVVTMLWELVMYVADLHIWVIISNFKTLLKLSISKVNCLLSLCNKKFFCIITINIFLKMYAQLAKRHSWILWMNPYVNAQSMYLEVVRQISCADFHQQKIGIFAVHRKMEVCAVFRFHFWND